MRAQQVEKRQSRPLLLLLFLSCAVATTAAMMVAKVVDHIFISMMIMNRKARPSV